MMRALTGILLCGGKSSRMGTDKALLEVNNHPMVTYPLSIMEEYCSEIILSANDDRLNFLGYRIIHDKMRDIGPMGGIYAGLKESSTELNLVFACDMPLISGRLLKRMIEIAGPFEAVVPLVDGRPEPLYALYYSRIIEKLEDSIKKQEYSMQKLLSRLNVFYFTADLEESKELFNMNTTLEKKNYEKLARKQQLP